MKRKNMFTLIELLVVIGIIAILLTILMPALKKSMETAYWAGCLSNLKQFGLAAHSYVNDYDGYIPNGAFNTWGASVSAQWCDCFRPYFDIKDNVTTKGLLERPGFHPFAEGAWHCPSNKGITSTSYKSTRTASYGMYRGPRDGYYTPAGTGEIVFKYQKQNHPHRYVLVGETNHSTRTRIYWHPVIAPPSDDEPWHNHGNSNNVLWLDASVSKVKSTSMRSHWPAWMAHSWTGCNGWCPSYYSEDLD